MVEVDRSKTDGIPTAGAAVFAGEFPSPFLPTVQSGGPAAPDLGLKVAVGYGKLRRSPQRPFLFKGRAAG